MMSKMIHEIMEDGPPTAGGAMHIHGEINKDPNHPGKVIETITSEIEPIESPLSALMGSPIGLPQMMRQHHNGLLPQTGGKSTFDKDEDTIETINLGHMVDMSKHIRDKAIHQM